MYELGISVNDLQELKNGRSVTVSQNDSELWDCIGSTVIFAPYKPGNLKSGDLVIVQLDRKAGIEPETRPNIDPDLTCSNLNDPSVTDGVCAIEIGEIANDGIFYVFPQETGWLPALIYPFTEDMIYGKAIDRDLIFSWGDLYEKSQLYEYGLYGNTLYGAEPDYSKLEIEYFTLPISTTLQPQLVWKFSAVKETYPNPADFWLDCVSYMDLREIYRFYFHEDISTSFCAPFTSGGIESLLKLWFGDTAEIPELLRQVKDNKRAMLMGWRSGVTSFLVEAEEKWIGIF